MRFTRRNPGFSLIEFMLVIAIIAVVSAIAIPRYANATKMYRVNLAAKRIAQDLQMAQFRARTLSASRTVVFSASADDYRIAGEKDFADSTAAYKVKLAELPYLVDLASAQFGTTVGTASVTFNGFGMPDNAGTITITSGGMTKTILLSAYDGGVTIP